MGQISRMVRPLKLKDRSEEAPALGKCALPLRSPRAGPRSEERENGNCSFSLLSPRLSLLQGGQKWNCQA